MNFIRIFAGILAFLGMALLIYGCFAYLNDGGKLFGVEMGKMETVVPFLLGIFFFFSGVSLLKSSSGKG